MSANIKEMLKKGFEEGINGRNLDIFASLMHKDYVNHSFPAPVEGPEGFKGVINMFLGGFPDMKITVEHIVAEGSAAATRGYFTGTHKGEFMGIPATGKSINVKYLDMWKLKDGLLHENWVVMDIAGLMQQISAMPS